MWLWNLLLSVSNWKFTRNLIMFGFILQQYKLLVDSVVAAQYQGSPMGQQQQQQQQARYPNSYQQQYGQKYPNEYQPQPQQPQQQHIDTSPHDQNPRYGNHNKNIYNPNNKPPGRLQNYQSNSSPINQQNAHANQRRPNTSVTDRSLHKCRIWVPTDAVDKYHSAVKIQVDQSNQLQFIEVCCPGYGAVRWRGSTVCRPICDNCQNGLCLAPGLCQCYGEYVKNDNGDCVFTCPLGCLNGRCYLDGSCQCDTGYKLDETRKFCRPICSAGCGLNSRHNCTEPEVCGCAKGYQLTDEGCQPTCTPDCGVGGYCREYNQCECGQGYELRDNVCQSDCYQKCDNGICYGRNRCICNPGYTYHEKTTQCIPA